MIEHNTWNNYALQYEKLLPSVNEIASAGQRCSVSRLDKTEHTTMYVCSRVKDHSGMHECLLDPTFSYTHAGHTSAGAWYTDSSEL